MTGAERLQDLAERFLRFGERECLPGSPLYAELSRTVAGDQALLALAAEAPDGQPAPNLLFAAVHFLLRRDRGNALASVYPSLTADPQPPAAAPALFRAFCASRRDSLVELLHTRSVGTNEVARCACLFPAFVAAMDRAGARPVHFFEIGASAGLNLLWPRYGYDYGGRTVPGEADAPVIRCVLKGGDPPVAFDRSRLGRIAGIDLQPLDPGNENDADWLQALVWPELAERRSRLSAAMRFARDIGTTVGKGDGIEGVPAFAAGLPRGDALCVVHSFTMNQVAEPLRLTLDDHLAEISQRRPAFRVGMEWNGAAVELTLTAYRPAPEPRLLAHADAHGGWLDWLT